jgi:hypothetical protein
MVSRVKSKITQVNGNSYAMSMRNAGFVISGHTV